MDQALEIKKTAISHLSRREYGSSELCKKLSLRFSNRDEIAKIVKQLTVDGLQCDLRFARSCIESRVRKGYGRRHIESVLQQKGLSRETVKQAFDERLIDWGEIITRTWQKKFSTSPPEDDKEKIKQTSFLLNRGFTTEQIKTLFSQLKEVTVF